MSPTIYRLKTHELKEIEQMVSAHQQEFKDAWKKYFPK